jgi:hypothetical protein
MTLPDKVDGVGKQPSHVAKSGIDRNAYHATGGILRHHAVASRIYRDKDRARI